MRPEFSMTQDYSAPLKYYMTGEGDKKEIGIIIIGVIAHTDGRGWRKIQVPSSLLALGAVEVTGFKLPSSHILREEQFLNPNKIIVFIDWRTLQYVNYIPKLLF